MTDLLARKDPAGIKPSVREGIQRSAAAVSGPHVVTQVDLDHLIERTAREARALVFGVQGGVIDAKDFGDRMAQLLEEAHGRAAYLGRVKGGDAAAFDQDDQRFGENVVDSEAEFLAHFQADIESGKYEGDWTKAEQRAEWYALRLTGTGNETWSLALPTGALITWVLGDEPSEHCPDCPVIAAGSPYTAETLPPPPGSNATKCLFRCYCSLEYEGGKSFTVPRSIAR